MNSDKSDVIWVGSRRTVSTHDCPPIRIENDTICATNKARLLGVSISTDLTFDQHVTSVSGQCFYQLRQLRSVRQSLDTESISTLIRAFVSSRVDYCCSLLIGSPRSVTDKLQRVLSAATPCYNQHQEIWKRVITDTASRPSLAGCYWTDSVPSGCNSISVSARHGSSVGLPDLTVYGTPVTASASRRGGLRSVTTSNLVVPRCRLLTYGTRAFRVAVSVCWNSLFKVIRSFVWLF